MINVLILNWNSAAEVATLIASLSASRGIDFRIVLIHNATNDEEELKAIPSYYPNIEFHTVINDENLGYAGGNNAGYEFIRRNKFEGDLLILNPDIVVRPNTLKVMVTTKERESNVVGVMVKTLSPNLDTIYDKVELKGLNHIYRKVNEPVTDTDYLAGSCMLLDRKVIDTIGLFDDKFFMYFEEVDLSLRMRNVGGRLVSTTQTHIVRKDNDISRSYNALYFSCRNAIYLYKKHDEIFFEDLARYLLRQLIWSIKEGIVRNDWMYLKKFVNATLSKTPFKVD